MEKVSCGHKHTLALKIAQLEGESISVAMSWGNNSNGQVSIFSLVITFQLGHGDTKPREIPTPIEAFKGKHVTNIFSGAMHSIIVVNGKL
jgi:hypothetical protein